jgi:hypothetical protein
MKLPEMVAAARAAEAEEDATEARYLEIRKRNRIRGNRALEQAFSEYLIGEGDYSLMVCCLLFWAFHAMDNASAADLKSPGYLAGVYEKVHGRAMETMWEVAIARHTLRGGGGA